MLVINGRKREKHFFELSITKVLFVCLFCFKVSYVDQVDLKLAM